MSYQIMGIGTDIVQIERIEQTIHRFRDHFIHRIFTKEEIEEAEKISHPYLKVAFYAKRYAAKEALSKALGTGLGQYISFKDICIQRLPSGAPDIKLTGSGAQYIQTKFNKRPYRFHISLSDDQMALAFIIFEVDMAEK